ncbi:MAG: VIT1/CCC1 transporter family protein [Candidatus Paceibacterota bacterium]
METGKKYLKEIVYGSIDGIITTFAIVSGVLGASLSSGIIIILGLANLFADGMSMAISNYLSVKSDIEKNEKTVNNFLDPKRTALATFLAFVIFGFFPLLSFILSSTIGWFNNFEFQFSIILTAIALFSVGMTKAKIVHQKGKGIFRSGVETLLIGSLAATVAFTVGFLLKNLV